MKINSPPIIKIVGLLLILQLTHKTKTTSTKKMIKSFPMNFRLKILSPWTMKIKIKHLLTKKKIKAKIKKPPKMI